MYRKIEIFFYPTTARPILMSKKYVMGLKRGMFGKNYKSVSLKRWDQTLVSSFFRLFYGKSLRYNYEFFLKNTFIYLK